MHACTLTVLLVRAHCAELWAPSCCLLQQQPGTLPSRRSAV